MRISLTLCLALAFLACGREKPAAPTQIPPSVYDPMKTSGDVQVLDFVITDATRNRDIPVFVYIPSTEKKEAAPVILFSHGLGGARENSPYLGKHWASRGYVAVFMQHIGSDESVWKNVEGKERLAAMKQAASAENFQLRVQDVSATLDQVERWNKDASHPLFGRLDLAHVGMCGHSFGAVTTQAVSGQSFGGQKLQEARIDAALAFSPSPPKQGSASTAFGSVNIPWMLMTGTDDNSPIGNTSAKDRMEVYPNLPVSIDAYELVLYDAEHSAFSEQALRGETKERNPNHHKAILALSTAFWDAYLKQDQEALTWLQGVWPRGVLEERDAWQSNQAK